MKAVSPASTELSEANTNQLVVFGLDDQRYALRLSGVEQVVRMVEITALPQAPEIILGVINIHGRIASVYNMRTRFRLPAREGTLSDHLIVAHTSRRAVALIVDRVAGVVARAASEMTETPSISPNLEYVAGVVKLEDGLVFIHDLETFLSIEEEARLDEALAVREPA